MLVVVVVRVMFLVIIGVGKMTVECGGMELVGKRNGDEIFKVI